jgi:hypothetical protein
MWQFDGKLHYNRDNMGFERDITKRPTTLWFWTIQQQNKFRWLKRRICLIIGHRIYLHKSRILYIKFNIYTGIKYYIYIWTDSILINLIIFYQQN